MPNDNSGKTVLCIEDERFISELYERALVKAGYKVKILHDGKAALKEAQTNQYDIILLDLMIPNMTGIEMLDKLRGPDGKSDQIDSKIIITTNLEQDDAGRAAIEKQADAYIVKAEITPKELVEFLNQLKL